MPSKPLTVEEVERAEKVLSEPPYYPPPAGVVVRLLADWRRKEAALQDVYDIAHSGRGVKDYQRIIDKSIAALAPDKE